MTKKIKFKRQKKKNGEAAYICPDFLKKSDGIEKIDENGVFFLSDGSINRVYKVSYTENRTDIYKFMRLYGCDFRIYHTDGNIYMVMYMKAEGEDIYDELHRVECDFMEKLDGYGIRTEALSLDERLRLVHKCVLRHSSDSNSNIMNYTDSAGTWKNDFLMSEYEEDNMDLKNAAGGRYKMFYLKQLPLQHVQELIQDLKKFDFVETVFVQLDSVSDEEIQLFFNANYMGCGSVLHRLERRDKKLYEILNGSMADDTRSYTMAGISFMVYTAPEEDDRKIMEQIDFTIKRYDSFYEKYSLYAKQNFRDFIPFGIRRQNQTRIVESEKVDFMLPSETAVYDEELMGLIM
jgi:hypothetical protein